MTAVNLGLRFGLELCMLAALALWGSGAGSGTALHVALGIGAPVAAATFWGLVISPRARFRPRRVVWVLLQLVLFGLTGVALVAAGHVAPAVGFVVAAVANLALLLAQAGSGPVS